MGSGVYSSINRIARNEDMAKEKGYNYYTGNTSDIFSSTMNEKMSPVGIDKRESRDSNEHPKSFPIIISLDVTGSMGSIPNNLIKDGLPKIMEGIINSGVEDPQVLFVAIGDSHCDSSPLQVGQFESSDTLLDYWLENVYLEGGGGGNYCESYLLAYHFALYHTVTDAFEKRNVKGILITIGDERYMPFEDEKLEKVYNEKVQSQDSKSLVEAIKEKWDVVHIHTNNKTIQGGVDIVKEWKELLGEQNVIVQNTISNIPDTIKNSIITTYTNQNTKVLGVSKDNIKDTIDNPISGNIEDVIPTKML